MATTRPAFEDTPEFERGHKGELLVAKELQRRGFFVIPSYDYKGDENNKAPRLQGRSSAYVIPDLDVAARGSRVWVEVKTKTSATFTRIKNRLEHGIPTRHFESYLQVQKITGCTVHLAIYEIDTGAVLMASISFLRSRPYRESAIGSQPMVYFAREWFREPFRINESGTLEYGGKWR